MTFRTFGPPPAEAAGFRVLAGRDEGLGRILVAGGRLPTGDVGPVHVHEGDEVLRVVSGEMFVRCGDERRICGPGDLVVVAPLVPHGFRVVRTTVVEVVAEYDIGTLYPVRDPASGTIEHVEVHRQDMPWGRPPPPGADWTDDATLQAILDRLAYDV